MKRNWIMDELIEFFTLTQSDYELISNKTGSTRLGFSVILKFFQLNAFFPFTKEDVPLDIIKYISSQLKLSHDLFNDYKFNDRTQRFHKNQIRDYYGFIELSGEASNELTEWLYKNNKCYERE